MQRNHWWASGLMKCSTLDPVLACDFPSPTAFMCIISAVPQHKARQRAGLSPDGRREMNLHTVKTSTAAKAQQPCHPRRLPPIPHLLLLCFTEDAMSNGSQDHSRCFVKTGVLGASSNKCLPRCTVYTSSCLTNTVHGFCSQICINHTSWQN